MNIVVCLKRVPTPDTSIRIAENSRWINEVGASYEMNEADAYALEAGLRLKDAHGGKVVAICAGSASAESTLREALAKGADSGILVEDERLCNADSLSVAHSLAAAIRREPCDLILTGLQSSDTGFGQTGVCIAELLGLPHATLIVELEAREATIAVKRELEGGWFERLELPLPALLTIQSGSNRVRYATLMGIKKAKAKPIERVTPAELGLHSAPRMPLSRLYAPEKSAGAVMFSGSAADVAQQLVDALKMEVHAL